MTFKRTKISTSLSRNKWKIKTLYSTKKNVKNNSNILRILFKILMFLIVFFFLWVLIFSAVLYKKYIADLPSISELENLDIAESSTIYDRNWIELYKVYKEKRTYVNFEWINKNMINALVAWEDKRYWVNPWVDLIWIMRALLYKATWKSDRIKWTSTITQQLIRNTIISNDRKIERKIKELYLAYKLSNWLSKEKIIELYLNKIEFWSNAFWVEQASKTFFWKQSKDLWILESSILASLPKWPTYYSPYNNPWRLLWYPYIYNNETKEDISKILLEKDKELNIELYNKFIEFIKSLKAKRIEKSDKLVICWLNEDNFKINISIDEDGCSVLKYSWLLNFLNWIRLSIEWYSIEYQTWRKDFILGRMLEDNYINFDDYKISILDSIAYKFKEVKENIKAPHFVFFVKEFLEKEYWEEVVSMWWLKVYTTLDYSLQEKANDIINKYYETNKKDFDAYNTALVSLDNKTWEIITMVWWVDYFDKDNKWNVNIITSRLQPWSTFKPFVYSVWFFENEIWTKTPIYDLETEFPWYTPSNYDWKFMWKIDITTALNNSRNIPAIKMFYLAGGEKNIISFIRKLWINSLKSNLEYWAPLGLWTWEITPLELAWAYSVFANMWFKKEINPILEIIDSKWNIVTSNKNKSEIKWDKVISDWQSYIINSMLSDKTSRPHFWNTYLSLKWRKVAAKTWTSTKQYKKWTKKIIYPRNLWTVWYTPDFTTVVWVWNTDWKELSFKWNWLEWAWPIWKDFMEEVHKWVKPSDWSKPSSINEIEVSTISWLPKGEKIIINNNFYTWSLFLNKPTKTDNSFREIEVDALCNWKITEFTPVAAIKEVTLVEFHSLSPTNINWENPVIEWVNSEDSKKKYWSISNLITQINEEECKRSSKTSNIVIKSKIINWDNYSIWNNYLELAYKSNNPIIKIDVLIWDILVDEIKLTNKTTWVYQWTFTIPSNIGIWLNKIKLRAVDELYYSTEEVKSININIKDKISPIINITNPSDLSIKLYNDSYFNLRWKIIDNSSIRTINIYIDGNKKKVGITDRNFKYVIFWKDYDLWFHTIRIDVIDNAFNTTTEEVRVEVINR